METLLHDTLALSSAVDVDDIGGGGEAELVGVVAVSFITTHSMCKGQLFTTTTS